MKRVHVDTAMQWAMALEDDSLEADVARNLCVLRGESPFDLLERFGYNCMRWRIVVLEALSATALAESFVMKGDTP